MSFDAYMADEKTRFAVMRGYEIMGEATRNLPPELNDANADIPQVYTAAVRNRIAHGVSDWMTCCCSKRSGLVQRFQGTTPIGRICPCMCGSSQILDLPAAERVSPGSRLAFRQSACRDFDRSPARALLPALVAFQLAEPALSRRKEC
jgi:hypothetical protein